MLDWRNEESCQMWRSRTSYTSVVWGGQQASQKITGILAGCKLGVIPEHSCQNCKHKTWQASHKLSVQDKGDNHLALFPPDQTTSGVQGARKQEAASCKEWLQGRVRSHSSYFSTNTSRADIWPRGNLICLTPKDRTWRWGKVTWKADVGSKEVKPSQP